jgi:uncharacterized membrane protein
MGRRLRWAGLAVIAAGVAVAIDAVLRGNASAFLVLIVPVVAGDSAEFFAAVLLTIVGAALLMAGTEGWTSEVEDGPTASRASTGGGGVILLGPVPIFWGSWARGRAGHRWAWALVGAASLVALLVAYWLAFGGV